MEDESSGKKRGPGRPPVKGLRTPKGGESSMALIRMPGFLRTAMENEAERTGRSMAQVGARWMEDGQAGRAVADKLLGDGRVAEAQRHLVAIARTIRTHVGDPEVSPVAHAALVSGWLRYIQQATLRDGLTAEEANLARERSQIREQCAKLLDVESALGVGLRGLPIPPVVRGAASGKAALSDLEVEELRLFAHGQRLETGISQSLVNALIGLEDACDAYKRQAGELAREMAKGIRIGRELADAVFPAASPVGGVQLTASDGRISVESVD